MSQQDQRQQSLSQFPPRPTACGLVTAWRSRLTLVQGLSGAISAPPPEPRHIQVEEALIRNDGVGGFKSLLRHQKNHHLRCIGEAAKGGLGTL